VGHTHCVATLTPVRLATVKPSLCQSQYTQRNGLSIPLYKMTTPPQHRIVRALSALNSRCSITATSSLEQHGALSIPDSQAASSLRSRPRVKQAALQIPHKRRAKQGKLSLGRPVPIPHLFKIVLSVVPLAETDKVTSGPGCPGTAG
jgi:hypothetical protein